MLYDVVILDDEVELAESTAEYLNLFNIKTSYVTTAAQLDTFLNEHKAKIILLDINLPDDSGFAICKRIRESDEATSIVFISARNREQDQVLALSIGGDDYIVKPYSLSYLHAKVNRMLLRLNADPSRHETYNQGNLTVDFSRAKVFIQDEEIPLKAMEYKLLNFLIKQRGKICTKDEIFSEVWEDLNTGDGTLNVHIHHLREKIEKNPQEPQVIRTVWGRGYTWDEAGQI